MSQRGGSDRGGGHGGARGLELVWPGKYDADGRRCPPPRRHPTLAVDGVLRPATAQAPQLQFFGDAARAAELEPPESSCGHDRLLVADNLLALDALCDAAPGSVDLIVADPPFSTGSRFDVVTRVGEGEAATEIRTPAYSDSWQGGAAGLIAMLDARLRLAHELLAPNGSLYLHVDPTVGHAVKLLLDDVFGPGCFQREIVWRIGWVSGFKTKARNWIRNHDLIFFYVKDPSAFTFNKHYVPYPEGYVRRDGKPPTGRGVPIDDVWNANETEFSLRGAESLDSIQIKSFSTEKSGYATQKNESIARRIIAASSNPGDRVLDAFCGSGTVGVAARDLGRQFIGVDCSAAAVHIASKRLRTRPGPSIVLERVETDARPDAAAFGDLVRRHHASAGRVVVVIGPHESADLAAIERARASAGDGPLDVLALRYELPLAGLPDDSPPTRLLRVTEDDFYPAVAMHPGAAVVALPSVELHVERSSEGGLAVSLDAYRVELGDAADVAGLGPLDTLDAWSLSWEPGTVGTGSFRTHQERSLCSTLECPAGLRPTELVVRFVDVRYQRSEVHLRIGYSGDEPQITSALLC